MKRKLVEEMTEDELREELGKALERAEVRKAKARAFFARMREESRAAKIEKDPKAYFTRRKDFEDAEKRGMDTSKIPKLNVI